MKFSRHVFRALCALCTGAIATLAAAQPVAPPPVEKLFARPAFNLARLSPDGRWLASATAPAPGRRIGLQIIDLDGKEAPRLIEASPKDNVIWFRWVDNDWLVFQVESPADRSAKDLGEGLIAMKRDGSGSRLLIDREFTPEDPIKRKRHLEPDHFYLAAGTPGSTEVIVGQAQWRDRQFSHVIPKVLNIVTSGLRSLLPDDAPRASGWLFNGGQARLAWNSADGQTTTWWAGRDGRWKEIAKAPMFEQPFAALGAGGDELYVETWAAGDGSAEIRRFDFAAGKPAATALFATPGFDSVSGLITERGDGRVLGISLATDGAVQVWLDPAMKALQEKVDARFPNNVNVIQCSKCDGSGRVLVYTYTDVDPGSYVLYEPKDDKWRLVGETMPGLDARAMSPMKFHRIKARDGREVPVWVTRPKSAAGKVAPAVVLVHGGPWERGREWGFAAEVQFLASRGYVVIEPEFRGSRGYGQAHYRAGFKQWGQAMQDDISDALQFAVKQGWADGKRACIMGASYGGYATLMGLVKDPDQFRCGVAFASVVDPRLLYDFHLGVYNRQARQFNLPVTLGDKVKDAEMLKAVAPVEHAARIKAPLLLAHGGYDFNVRIEHGERMRDALRREGKSVEWVSYSDEGHGFFYDENRFDYYRRVEAFLAKHLKP